jgi:hypothetical protein
VAVVQDALRSFAERKTTIATGRGNEVVRQGDFAFSGGEGEKGESAAKFDKAPDIACMNWSESEHFHHSAGHGHITAYTSVGR